MPIYANDGQKRTLNKYLDKTVDLVNTYKLKNPIKKPEDSKITVQELMDPKTQSKLNLVSFKEEERKLRESKEMNHYNRLFTFPVNPQYIGK